MNPLLSKKLDAFFESADIQLGKSDYVAQQATHYIWREVQPDVFKIILKEIAGNKAACLTWMKAVREPHERILQLQADLEEAFARYNYAQSEQERAIFSDQIAEITHDLEMLKPMRATGLQILGSMLEEPVEQRIGEKITRLKNSTIPTQINALNNMISKADLLFTSFGFSHDEFVRLCSAYTTYADVLKSKKGVSSNNGQGSKKNYDIMEEAAEFIQSKIKSLGERKGLTTYNEEDLFRLASIIEVTIMFEEEKTKLYPLSGEIGSNAQKRIYKNNSGISSNTPRFDYYFNEFARKFYSDEVTLETDKDNFAYISRILSQLNTSEIDLINKHIYGVSTQPEPHKHIGQAPVMPSDKGEMGRK